ncbi:MAG: helicase C-terminal domain-containing protein [Anaerolineales bacterium]|jgi:DNA polymerase-3 subunit epsilon/ATP-dependent DNA helicase DinG
MTSIIALDLETTGLDPQTDTILEIGARRFDGHRVEAEFSTLINPGRHIPEFITGLTGISDEMVRQAPRIRDVLDELAAFIGDSPILGHNIQFDLSFLKKYKLIELNERIDTYELAAVLLPSASRYNLGSLVQLLGIALPATHRALDDARATHAVYQRLFTQACELPLDLLAEIVRHSEPIEWDGAWAFQQALRSRSHEGIKAKHVVGQAENLDVKAHPNIPSSESSDIEKHKGPPIQVPKEYIPIDPEEAASFLEHGGPFARYFESFEYRPEQIEMCKAVANALSYGQHLMVEAGTGVGKSFAYLVPSSLFALQNNTRVIISTNTINLQDQLIRKDIPDLCAALSLDLRATVLKGRSNYLCPRRLELLRKRGPDNADEMRILAKVLVWQQENSSGDRTEINLTGPSEREVWVHVSAEDDACTSETCLERTGGACPFFRAKQAAQNTHILVVNHALLLTDVAIGNRILPDYEHVIIDEGHHLESATTDSLSFRLTQFDIERLIREIGGSSSGILGHLLSTTHDQVRPSDYALLNQKVERATDLVWRLQEQARIFFDALTEFVSLQREGQPATIYAYQERILPATRTQPGWDDVEITWSAGSETLSLLVALLGEIQKGVTELYSNGLESLEDIISNLGNVYRRLTEAENMVGSIIFEPVQDYVYWVEVNPNNNRMALNAAPIHVGPLIEKYLWHEKRSVILTSATLTTHGEFNYIRNTLTADEADELALGSPFDYENAALLYIANDIAEPNAHEYQGQLDRTLINLCQASGGRTLVLFTSYAQLKRTSKNIAGPLAKQEIIVYEQGEGASPNALLESFKSSERAILLGTRSFWEGVDIPGEALSVVVIAKLPFAVPSDPLVAARSETFEDPFNEYHLPEAILRFRQGFGRLIRTQSDRGVVAILDRRVLTKPYGKLFIESLPHCTLRVSSLSELPHATAKWLGL